MHSCEVPVPFFNGLLGKDAEVLASRRSEDTAAETTVVGMGVHLPRHKVPWRIPFKVVLIICPQLELG